MKIRLSQLKRIIKEEVARATRTTKSHRRLSEMGSREFLLDVPDCSMIAEDMDMSLDEFLKHVMAIGSKYPSIRFEGASHLGGPYSEEFDTLSTIGSKSDLTKFAQELDQEYMGGAQSIADEDSLVNAIEPF